MNIRLKDMQLVPDDELIGRVANEIANVDDKIRDASGYEPRPGIIMQRVESTNLAETPKQTNQGKKFVGIDDDGKAIYAEE
jgi:hypothetical protein